MGPPDRRLVRSACVLVAGGVLASAQFPADPDELKVVPVYAPVEDRKSDWPPPSEHAATEPVRSARPAPRLEAPAKGEPRRTLRPEPFPDLADRVILDEPGDGALWARGGYSYKARFDREGLTYFPLFGHGTPGHFPLALALEEVLLGGQPLAFGRQVPYERLAAGVLYDRGSLIEHHELEAHSLAPSFHFDGLPGTGDLVLGIALRTELEVLEGPHGIELSCAFGQVAFGAALARDGAGRIVAAPTRLVAGRIEIEVPASFLGTATFPLVVAPRVEVLGSGASRGTQAGHQLFPDVAYDESTERWALPFQEVVNASDHDVFVVLRELSSGWIGIEPIDITTDCWQRPRIANNQIADQFLVVAQVSSNCTSPYSILGRTLQASGSLGTPFVISVGGFGDQVHPDVGGDPVGTAPTYYCVVWERVFSASDHDIHYQLVSAGGTLLLPSTGLIDNSGGTKDRYPSISRSNGQAPFSGQNWNIAWERELSATDRDVHGAQVLWSGTITTPSFLALSGHDTPRPQASTFKHAGTTSRPYVLGVMQRKPAPQGADFLVSSFQGASALSALEHAPAGGGSFVEDTGGQFSLDSDGTHILALLPTILPGGTDFEIHFQYFGIAGSLPSVMADPAGPLWSAPPPGWVLGPSPSRLFITQSSTNGLSSSPPTFAGVFQALDAVTGLGANYAVMWAPEIEPGLAMCVPSNCPCANSGTLGAGCLNSTGVGAQLSGGGSNSVSAGNLVLEATHALPFQPGIFFQGSAGLNAWNGFPLGNGLLCCGGSTVRFQVVVPDAGGTAATSWNLAAAGGVLPGNATCYQYWYRDFATYGTCSSGFNFTNAYDVIWTF